MKKILVLLFLVQAVTLFAKDELPNPGGNGWTLARLCFTQGGPAYPRKKSVYGINLGLPTSYNYNYFQKIYGLDVGFVVVESKADGLQLGIMNFSKGSDGMQCSFANVVKDFSGFQFAVANVARKSEVFQLGFLNFARRGTSGIQLGFLNFNDKGFLPIFPIINFGF